MANCEERAIPVPLFLNTECPTAEHLASTRSRYSENNTLWIRDNSGGLEGAEGRRRLLLGRFLLRYHE